MPLTRTIDEICVHASLSTEELCVRVFNTEVCASVPNLLPPTPDERVKALIGALNSALAPAQPIFDIVGAVLAIAEFAKAASQLDVEEMLEKLKELLDKVGALAKLIPQLALPVLIYGVLNVLVTFLQGYRDQLAFQANYMQRILAAELTAARPGSMGLNSVIACARRDFDDAITSLNSGLEPVKLIIVLTNSFLDLIGLSKFRIPDIANVDPLLIDNAFELFDTIIDVLVTLRAGFAPVVGQASGAIEDLQEISS